MNHSKHRTSTLKVLIRIATLFLLLFSMLNMTEAAKAASYCECVDYVKNAHKLTGAIGSEGAKSMGPYLIARGFRQVAKPQVGAVVIFQPAFGGGIDQTYGHVGIITAVEDHDTKWRIKVEGANQGGSDTKYGCNNVNNIFYTKYLKTWGASRIAYYVPPKPFTSNFSTNAAGWEAVKGAWKISSAGYYHSAGKSNMFSSAIHSGNFSTLTYQVVMKASGCSNCGNYIYFRGQPTPLNSDGRWNSGYVFEYTNNGYWLIGKQNNGEFTAFMDWTYSPHISSSWNTLRVSAYGDHMEFYINDVLLATRQDTEFLAGQSGVGFYKDSFLAHLYVDSASLKISLPLTLADINKEGVIDLTGSTGTADPRVSP